MNPAPYFPFFCVARRLKYPVFRPPRALRKEKHVPWIDTPTTGRGTSAASGSWRINPAPYFPFFCVARRLKYPVFCPPRALRKEKHVPWIDTPTTGRGTSAPSGSWRINQERIKKRADNLAPFYPSAESIMLRHYTHTSILRADNAQTGHYT